MKKIATITSRLAMVALAALMTMGIAACGDDNDEPSGPTGEAEITANVQVTTLMAATGTYAYTEPNAATVEVEFNGSNSNVDVELKGLRFSSRMPITIDIDLDDMKVTGNDNDRRLTFSLAKHELSANYALTDIKGYVDLDNKVLNMSFKVNDSYLVNIAPQTVFTALASGTDYSTTGEQWNSFTWQMFDTSVNSPSTAWIDLYNVKFSERMPVTLKQARITLDAYLIQHSATGWSTEQESGLKLSYLDNTTWIPFDGVTISGLKATVDYTNATYSLEFSAMGETWSSSGKLFLK